MESDMNPLLPANATRFQDIFAFFGHILDIWARFIRHITEVPVKRKPGVSRVLIFVGSNV